MMAPGRLLFHGPSLSVRGDGRGGLLFPLPKFLLLPYYSRRNHLFAPGLSPGWRKLAPLAALFQRKCSSSSSLLRSSLELSDPKVYEP